MASWKHMVPYAVLYRYTSHQTSDVKGKKSEGHFFSFQIQPTSIIATIYTSESVSVTYHLTINDHLLY